MHSPIHRAPAALALLAASALLAIALLLTGSIAGNPAGSGPAVAEAGCNQLNVRGTVKTRFSKPFARQYKRNVKVSVVQKGPDKVRDWHAELFTFSGFRLGKSKPDNRLDGTETTKIRLKQPLQPGKYTMVIKGSRDSCGFKEKVQVEKFRSCLNRLPIKFFDRPGGTAADYDRFVSVGISPRPEFAPIKKVRSRLKSADGVLYGKAELPKGFRNLIGEQYLHHKLDRDLDPGEYRVNVTGRAPQPRSCGEVKKSATLRFS